MKAFMAYDSFAYSFDTDDNGHINMTEFLMKLRVSVAQCPKFWKACPPYNNI